MYKLLFIFFLIVIGCSSGMDAASADSSEWTFGGHAKLQYLYQSYPDNSIFNTILGSSSRDANLETRLKAAFTRDRWTFNLDYQFIGIHGDSLQLAESLPGSPLPLNSVINDDRRWWNLTHSFGSGDTAFIHRLDRLNVGFTSGNMVMRFGRQAISWGNGMIFNPVDVFNPFDPAAVDKEYKTGDDMAYGQYLFGNGNDLQAVAIVRRNPHNGEVEKEESSLAFKYHGFLGMNEYDLLAAEHFGDQIFAVGGNLGIGGAVWRGDLSWTRTDRDSLLSVVTSLSYSWTWGGRNLSGVLEYYYNGFGQSNGAYAPADLRRNPDLFRRLERGELYNLARHYIGASATIELTPLFLLIPNLFVNLEDPSALMQIVAQYDWKQNVLLLGALNLPLGSDGSEFGGIEAPADGLYYSSGPGVFAQLAWYF
jgi:hypothetical protein